MSGYPHIETHLLADDGETPNHPVFPLVVMRLTEATSLPDAASWFEETFQRNGWGSTWRWTVYPYHHFHTTNHEVLGVSRGTAVLLLGGASGKEFTVSKGDVIMIPAGVGHKRLGSSGDFQVTGGYPGGKEPDLILPAEQDISLSREQIAKVGLPALDPVHGINGPLSHFWKV